MDSAVLAAIVGVAGTVVVGVAGFGASIYNTRKAVNAARDLRLRDQRSKAYVDALIAMHYRQVKRDAGMPRGPRDPEIQKGAQAYLDAFKQPDWYLLEAHLVAFGSAKVFAAIQQSSAAERKAWACFGNLKKAAPGSEGEKQAVAAWRQQWQAASDAHDAAMELIRFELQGSGPSLADFDMFPSAEE